MKPSGSGHSRIIANNPRGARESRSELGAPVRYAVFSIASRLRFRPASSNPPPIVTADREREKERNGQPTRMLIYRARYERLLLNSH